MNANDIERWMEDRWALRIFLEECAKDLARTWSRWMEGRTTQEAYLHERGQLRAYVVGGLLADSRTYDLDGLNEYVARVEGRA